MKKFVSFLLSLCLIGSLSISVFAQDAVVNQDSTNKSTGTAISAIVSPTYTVTIPQTVVLNHTATIKADHVLTESNKMVTVTLTGTNQENNAFVITTADGAAIGYQILKDDHKPFVINDSLTFETDGSYDLSFEQILDDQIFSGNYSGTITFTVGYKSMID